MADQRDLTGVWYGRYEAELWDERNGFIALIDESGGALAGTISERDTTGTVPVRRAVVNGRRSADMVQFVKRYDGTGGHDHAIRYAGRVDPEGTVVTGTWELAWARGTFTMEREKFDAAALDVVESAEIESPAVVAGD